MPVPSPKLLPSSTLDTRTSLASRLTRLALIAAGLALAVAGVLLNVALYFQARDTLVDDTVAQARVIAVSSTAALVFGDAAAAAEILGSLSNVRSIDRATLFDRTGAVLSEHHLHGPVVHARSESMPVHVADYLLRDDWLSVLEPVIHGGAAVGQVRVEVPMRPLYLKAAATAGVTALCAAVALLLAYLFAVGVRRDVRRIERRMRDLAYVDTVTGLFNRNAAGEHLAESVRAGQAGGEGFSVVTIDIDDFKKINDTLGHAAGDALLCEVARRLTGALSPSARAYRFGGDEFVIVCPDPNGFRDPDCYGHRIGEALGGAFLLDGRLLHLGGSVGVARFPIDGSSASEVLRASDLAMYRAKANGKNQVVVFDAHLRAASEQSLRIESELWLALERGELRLFYQPIVELASGRTVGAEALVRWQHPQRGLLGPADFIDVAESTGLVVPLGGWVLAEAARQLARWDADGLAPMQMAVNVSARQLGGDVLLQQYRSAVDAAGCAPQRLEIELTEHTLVDNVDVNLRLLNRLRDWGVSIAIDDFGTGLSSLAYLKHLPVNKLKIDRSFVDGLPGDAGDHAIVSAAVSMAHALGMQVVAEGVETRAQADVLCGLHASLAQGWLFGRPVDAQAFAQRLRDQDAAQSPLSICTAA
ncbi:putative bifunctional diguanylate cyclase/phosphodiesterase [Leptothrix cholodnii]|nr:EAL domain-containing protein [Leptothrix cholodnii]